MSDALCLIPLTPPFTIKCPLSSPFLLLELGGEVKAGGGAGGVAPVLYHWLLDLLGVPSGLGADLLGDINTLLDFLKTK